MWKTQLTYRWYLEHHYHDYYNHCKTNEILFVLLSFVQHNLYCLCKQFL